MLATVICLGFNHHHKTSPQSWDNPPRPPLQPADVDEPFDAGDYNPEGKRVWSWLILCDDGKHPPPHCHFLL